MITYLIFILSNFKNAMHLAGVAAIDPKIRARGGPAAADRAAGLSRVVAMTIDLIDRHFITVFSIISVFIIRYDAEHLLQPEADEQLA